MTFASFAPKLKIGCLQPGAIIDNAPYEFYRLAPPGVMLVMVGVGLREFSSQDVERVFAPLDRYLDQLMDRGVDLIMQNGVPLPILIGINAHDRIIAHMGSHTGIPATSTVLSVVRAASDFGIDTVAVVNKWSDEMNQSLATFFARGGVRFSAAQPSRCIQPTSTASPRVTTCSLPTSLAAAHFSTTPIATRSISAAAPGSQSRSRFVWKRSSASPCCATRRRSSETRSSCSGRGSHCPGTAACWRYPRPSACRYGSLPSAVAATKIAIMVTRA